MDSCYPLVKMGQFLRLRKEFFTIDDTEEYQLVTVQLHARGIRERSRLFGSEIKTKKQQRVKAGDLLVAEIDAKVGGYGIVPPELDGAIVSGHYFLYEIDQSQIVPEYLGYYVKTGYPEQDLQQFVKGSVNYAAIRSQHFFELEIPLPPLEDQRRIVEKVTGILGRCGEIKVLQDHIEQLSQDLILNLHMQASEKDPVLLRDILEHYEERIPISSGVDYPQVGLKAYGQGMFHRESVIGGETTYKYFNYVYEGALVLSQVKGWEGALAVCPPQLVGHYASPEYRTFRCKPGSVVPEYLAFLFATPWFYSQLTVFAKGIGGRRNRIHPEQFLSLSIPMPIYEKQVKLLQIFQKIEMVKSNQRLIVPAFEAFAPSILNKAYGGSL
ncbi:MAG TPA: restriction endonuclease subunit S [Bellilinea sp.]|nr:restriction endonuclease subunit S [Bellilinea sp.]